MKKKKEKKETTSANILKSLLHETHHKNMQWVLARIATLFFNGKISKNGHHYKNTHEQVL